MHYTLNKILDYLLIIKLAVMTIVVASNVFFRFVLNYSIYWADELAMILLVWLTFLGAAVAVRDRSHYVFAYLVYKLDGLVLKIYILTRNILSIIAIILLGFYSTYVSAGITDWVMPALGISRAFVYLAAPVGCFFMLYYSVNHLVQDFLNSSEKGITEIKENKFTA